jgi:hypothetical protein
LPSASVPSVTVMVTGTPARPWPAALCTVTVHFAGRPMICGEFGAVTAVVHGPWLVVASVRSRSTAAWVLAGIRDRWKSAS